jgi:hypothetical protein
VLFDARVLLYKVSIVSSNNLDKALNCGIIVEESFVERYRTDTLECGESVKVVQG